MKIHITNLYGMAEDSTVILAQNAVTEIALQLGYREMGIYYYDASTDSRVEMMKRMDGIMSSVSVGDMVIFQSPTWNGWQYDRLFMDKLQMLQAKIAIFIHDVGPLMFPSNDYLMPEYMAMYNMADVVILPSEKMKDRLIQEGLQVETVLIQHLWDHPHHQRLNQPELKKEIFFAGTLERFPDLQNWSFRTPLRVFANDDLGKQELNMTLEGWKRDDELLLEMSKGGFGLVWDTQKNTEENTDYYQLNASHKLSTYLAAGIPVIVPKSLSSADLIREKQLGFVVDSLEEADRIVQEITPEEYAEIQGHVAGLSFLLKEGYITRKLLVDSVYHLAWQ